MQPSVFRPTLTLADEAAALKSYLETRGDEAFAGPDPWLIDTLRRFNASDIIALVDTIAFPMGSALNIHLS